MWHVIGHTSAVELLRRSIRSNRVFHAYLFTGPDHVGKRTLAIEFARALNCEAAPDLCSLLAGPSSTCRACRLIARGTHPDVREIELQSGRRRISFEEINALQRDLVLRPLEANYKVYLISEADLLSSTAANQLLKTIEEPPPHAVIVLTARSPDALLPTIVSRCQHLPLLPLPLEIIASHLTDRMGTEPATARLVARLSQGRIGWAISAVSGPDALELRARALDELHTILRAGRLQRLKHSRELAERWVARPTVVRESIEFWLSWWRDVLLAKIGLLARAINIDRLVEIEQASRLLPMTSIAGAISCLTRTVDYLESNCSPRLTMDVMALDLPYLRQ